MFVCLTLLPPHTPEGTHTEITKGQAKTQRDREARRLTMARLVLCKLAAQGDSADGRQRKENKARNFEPQLVQHARERTQRNPPRLQDRAHGPALPRVLSGHLREDTEFLELKVGADTGRFYQCSGLQYPQCEEPGHNPV